MRSTDFEAKNFTLFLPPHLQPPALCRILPAQIETASMQRTSAQAKAISQREALRARLTLAAAMLLLPAALLLLLISP
jgi:hypothetical protein